MRRDPLLLAFSIASPSYDESVRLREKVRHQIEPEAEIIDKVTSAKVIRDIHHRIGDYFEGISILPDDNESACSFRLIFHRKPDAGRFWKDIMVRIIRSLEMERGVTVTLEHQGDVLVDSMNAVLAK